MISNPLSQGGCGVSSSSWFSSSETTATWLLLEEPQGEKVKVPSAEAVKLTNESTLRLPQRLVPLVKFEPESDSPPRAIDIPVRYM